MRAISSMATRHVLADLAVAAGVAGFGDVAIESVGGVDAARRVAAGEAFDLVLLAGDALAALAADGYVLAETVTPLVVSQVAAAVPAVGVDGAVAPAGGAAFADAAGLRAALTDAEKIGYSTGPSGTALLALIEGWGLTDEVGPKLVQARPGIPVAKLLEDGEVDLGLQQLSELVGAPGIRILGPLPADCAIVTVFGGAVAAASSDPQAAAAVLEFLASDAAAEIKRRHSFEVTSA